MFRTNKNFRNAKMTALSAVTAFVLAVVCFITPMLVPTASACPDYSVGSSVYFGHYEQDNNYYNGAEAIEWIVLQNNYDSVLLISRYALDSERYNYRADSTSWTYCSLRQWLNGVFYYDAFSWDERSRLYAIDGDMVSIPTVSQAETYFSGNRSRICQATRYASTQNVYVNPTTGGSWWLLRTTGWNGSKFVMSVNSDGSIDYNGGHVESDRGTVRPIIRLSK